MPRKKKTKSVTSTKKSKSSRTKPSSARKTSTKKQEVEILPVLNAEKLKDLYATMTKCRLLAEKFQERSQRNETPGSVLGFEATLVGAGAHLLTRDCIAMEHSSFVASLIKGTPLHSILARNSESQSGNGTGNPVLSQHKEHPLAALNMETVLALAAEMRGQGAVTLMFCTHNSETLVFDPEAMAIAATQKLPLVCLVESSLEAPLQLPNQIASGPYIGADTAFYPRIPVDGCDVVGVFRVAQEAIRRAREGHGPAVIECLTGRSNVATKNQHDRASAQYLAQDPLAFMERYLRRRDLWSDEWAQAIVERFNQQLSEAAISLANQTGSESEFDNVYSSEAQAPRPAAASAR